MKSIRDFFPDFELLPRFKLPVDADLERTVEISVFKTPALGYTEISESDTTTEGKLGL